MDVSGIVGRVMLQISFKQPAKFLIIDHCQLYRVSVLDAIFNKQRAETIVATARPASNALGECFQLVSSRSKPDSGAVSG